MKKQLLFILALILMASCENYGDKLTFDGTDIYYKDGVTKEQATQLGNYLIAEEFADGSEKAVQLLKDTETNIFTFKMIVDESILDDTSYDYIFKTFARDLSEEFKTPIDFHLADNAFNTLKGYLFSDLPKSIYAKATQILYTSKITALEATTLKNYLIESKFADESPKTIEFDKKNDTYLFRMVIKEGLENDENTVKVLKVFGEAISKDAFNNKPLKVHMCNNNLITLKEI